MGCGKGGDLQKWSKAGIAEYVGMDIAALSVDQAYHRWDDMQKSKRSPFGKFDAEFASLDCYVVSKALHESFDEANTVVCLLVSYL